MKNVPIAADKHADTCLYGLQACAVVPGKKKTKEYRKKKNSRVYMILGEWNFLFVSSLTVVFHTIIWQIKEKIIHKDEFQTR